MAALSASCASCGLLLLSSAILAFCGLVKAVYASLFLLVALQTLNGWVQGMGWPPCGKTMVHWFSTKERGLTVSIWNTAHNLGGALVANFALLGVTLFHDWGAKFYFNALIAAGLAVAVYFLLQDTPQSRGLPPVEQYKNDYPPGYSEDHERTLGWRAGRARFFSTPARRSPWPPPRRGCWRRSWAAGPARPWSSGFS